MEPVISELGEPVEVERVGDADLVRRSLVDPQAFARVFDRHFVAVHRYIHRRAGRDIADELASETFRIAFERRGRWSRRSASARPWLYGIATNLLRRHRRTEERRLRAIARDSYDQWSELDEDAIVSRLDAVVDARGIATALALLSSRDRDVVTLVALGGLTQAEVAEALAIPLGTVASRMRRAQRAIVAASPEDRDG
jgi:RNA polymerase sigma factor (sigma-70 family)